MPYAKNFLRLAVVGTLYDKDVFTFGLNFSSNVDGATPPPEVPQAVIDAVTAYWQGSTPIVSTHAKVTTLKLNEIGTNGKYTGDATVLHDFVTPLPGTGGATPAPQTSLAISLTTPRLRGRAHAGRYYLPLPAPEAQSDGVISLSQAGEQANAAQDFLGALNEAVVGYDLAIQSNLGTGTYQFVTGVRVGRVLDTIRSRRSAFSEDYTSVPVVPTGR